MPILRSLNNSRWAFSFDFFFILLRLFHAIFFACLLSEDGHKTNILRMNMKNTNCVRIFLRRKKNRILWKEIKSSAPTKDPNDCNFTLSPLQQEWQQQAGGSDENQRKKTEPKQKLLQKQQLRVRISEQLLSNHWATVGNAHAIIMNMPIAEKRYCRKNHTRWMYVMYLCTITPYLCLNRVLRHLILSFLFYGIRSLC